MDLIAGILLNGLALGAMYAMGTIALSVIWGALGMLNLAHGAILALGAYAAVLSVEKLGLPWWASLGPAILAGAAAGLFLYFCIVKWLYRRPNFPINTVITTIALAALTENLINQSIGAEVWPQPFRFDGSLSIAGISVRAQPLVVLCAALLFTIGISWLLGRTALGRAIRAVSQQRDAASLMGISVPRTYAQILMITGVVSAVSGVLLTGMTTVYPTVGGDPTTKALIICACAGLGSLRGATALALAFGLVEVAVQYTIGARFGTTAALLIAISLLVWRPYGIFGTNSGGRL
ncbi:MAG: branched-chain amino acid ABC transporter permease [Rhodovulum sulfidophilum]|uniref:Branched-chain amino acid ABC transporter permease n=1 Tax=Rhodovulum sulfidophilum TaxID=35806 RepID=A0A2W5N032_RHOSU|nr:MAG: branched-chain amino acid ABC transporter permease [Rhodovulum sulfidophilum]